MPFTWQILWKTAILFPGGLIKTVPSPGSCVATDWSFVIIRKLQVCVQYASNGQWMDCGRPVGVLSEAETRVNVNKHCRIILDTFLSLSEQWETDEAVVCHSSHDVRFRTAESEVYQHERSDGWPMKVYKSRQFMNVWTEHEKEIFKEKVSNSGLFWHVEWVWMCCSFFSHLCLFCDIGFVQHPKNFVFIASFWRERWVSFFVTWVWWTPRMSLDVHQWLFELKHCNSFTDSDHTSPPTDSIFSLHYGIFFSN